MMIKMKTREEIKKVRDTKQKLLDSFNESMEKDPEAICNAWEAYFLQEEIKLLDWILAD